MRPDASPTSRPAFAADGELLGLRYDALEDVGAYVRAPEPATLYRMHGSLSGAYRVRNVAARNRVVLTNRCPTGSTGASAVRSCTSRSSGRWTSRAAASDSTRPSCGGATSCADDSRTRPRAAAVYDSGDYEACLDDALELVRYDERRAEQAAGRRSALGIACVVEPSISNMGYITLAQTPAERAAGLPKSGNAEGCIVTVGPLGGITVRIVDDAAGPGTSHGRRADRGRSRSASTPEDVDVITEMDTSTNAVDGRLRQLLVALQRRRRRRRRRWQPRR